MPRPERPDAVGKVAHEIVANNAHPRTTSPAATTRPAGRPNIWTASSPGGSAHGPLRVHIGTARRSAPRAGVHLGNRRVLRLHSRFRRAPARVLSVHSNPRGRHRLRGKPPSALVLSRRIQPLSIVGPIHRRRTLALHNPCGTQDTPTTKRAGSGRRAAARARCR